MHLLIQKTYVWTPKSCFYLFRLQLYGGHFENGGHLINFERYQMSLNHIFIKTLNPIFERKIKILSQNAQFFELCSRVCRTIGKQYRIPGTIPYRYLTSVGCFYLLLETGYHAIQRRHMKLLPQNVIWQSFSYNYGSLWKNHPRLT